MSDAGNDNAIVDSDTARVQKRRASSTSNDPSKRPRLSTELSADSPATLRNSPPSPKADLEALRAQRRNSQAQEEKKRGRRLFGGLLNTLSQGSSVTHIKKRQEIEKRQADRAAKAREEDDGRKQERLEKLKTIRQREARRFHERTLQTRHDNLLTMAHFLSTKAEPKLYYKPWKLLSSDEELINAQIHDAQSIIDKELKDFKDQTPTPKSQEETAQTSETQKGENVEPLEPAMSIDSTNKSPQASHETTGDAADQDGEVVVEADEDTVIY